MIPTLDLLYLCTSLLFYMLVCLLFHPFFFFFRNSVSPSQVLHLTPLQLLCHVANTVTASGAASRLTLRSLFISESSREQRHKRTHVLGHHPRSCSRLQSFGVLAFSFPCEVSSTLGTCFKDIENELLVPESKLLKQKRDIHRGLAWSL